MRVGLETQTMPAELTREIIGRAFDEM